MLYGKLPIVLVSTIATQKNESTNSVIATYLLNHLSEVKNMGINELALSCNVSMSSISRFCKEIGLRDYNELRNLLVNNDFKFENSFQDYADKVENSIQLASKTVDEDKILKLCKDIRNYKKVAVFGLLKGSGAAINLQSDLLMLSKQVYTNVAYSEQLNYILDSKEDTLIVLFSYTGVYFDYTPLRAKEKKLYQPKIWMITGSELQLPDYIDDVIRFESKQDQASHPYQLDFIAGLIAQNYAKLIHNN